MGRWQRSRSSGGGFHGCLPWWEKTGGSCCWWPFIPFHGVGLVLVMETVVGQRGRQGEVREEGFVPMDPSIPWLRAPTYPEGLRSWRRTAPWIWPTRAGRRGRRPRPQPNPSHEAGVAIELANLPDGRKRRSEGVSAVCCVPPELAGIAAGAGDGGGEGSRGGEKERVEGRPGVEGSGSGSWVDIFVAW